MNLLLIRPGDLDADRTFTVSGSRAEHIRTVLRAKPGETVRTGFVNGNCGTAEILSLEKERAVLRAGEFPAPPPEPLLLSLAVALPRPQSLKKVLHFAVSAGIRDLVFFQSVRVEKSYWNSSVLEPDALDAEILEGLEQGVDTIRPDIRFYRHFREFLEESAERYSGETVKIVAHPGRSAAGFRRNGRHVLLAIGPEGGFVKSEVEALAAAGFEPRGFGSHILRVEFAAAYIAGFLMGCR